MMMIIIIMGTSLEYLCKIMFISRSVLLRMRNVAGEDVKRF